MTTKMDKDKHVVREVAVKDFDGNSGVIHVTMTATGITLRGKGTKRELTVAYCDIAALAASPQSMPNKFNENKLGWLIDVAKKEPKSPTDPVSPADDDDNDDNDDDDDTPDVL